MGAGRRETRGIEPGLQARAAISMRDELRPATHDRALRIFTSGTTGLPKAAEVSHRRIGHWSHWFAGLAGLTATDRLYNCLPMHHSVGGVVAIGAPLVFGGFSRYCPALFGSALLGRRRALGVHGISIYRRTLSLSYCRSHCPEEKAAQAAARNRQWALGRSVARRSGPLRAAPHPRILCFDGRQRLALQRRRQDRINWPGPAVPRYSATRSRSRGSTTIAKRPREGPTDFVCVARKAKSARLWDA